MQHGHNCTTNNSIETVNMWIPKELGLWARSYLLATLAIAPSALGHRARNMSEACRWTMVCSFCRLSYTGRDIGSHHPSCQLLRLFMVESLF